MLRPAPTIGRKVLSGDPSFAAVETEPHDERLSIRQRDDPAE
jgi:hypothetical protein